MTLRVCYILFALALSSRVTSALLSSVIGGPDRNVHNGRDGSGGGLSCTGLTLDQAKQLPGWPKIKQFAKDNFGDDKLTYIFNPPEYPDRPAVVCIDQEPILISTQDTPSCSQSTSAIEGTIIGTTGTMTLSYSEGYSNSATWSVIQESSLAHGVTLTATFGLPELAHISDEVVTTATFSNSLSQGFTTNINNQLTQGVTVNTVPGKTCSGTLTTTTCTVSGNGTVQYVASGFVWFYYSTKRAPKSNSKAGQHYRWSAPIATAIQNLDDWSSFMKFTGVMQINNKANFSDTCS